LNRVNRIEAEELMKNAKQHPLLTTLFAVFETGNKYGKTKLSYILVGRKFRYSSKQYANKPNFLSWGALQDFGNGDDVWNVIGLIEQLVVKKQIAIKEKDGMKTYYVTGRGKAYLISHNLIQSDNRIGSDSVENTQDFLRMDDPEDRFLMNRLIKICKKYLYNRSTGELDWLTARALHCIVLGKPETVEDLKATHGVGNMNLNLDAIVKEIRDFKASH